MKNIRLRCIWLAVITIALTACGGSSSSSSGSGDDSGVITGSFVDSPVENLHYRTATQSGSTDSNGGYRYKFGEQIVFSIGFIEFPPVAASVTITPWDLFAPVSDYGDYDGAQVTKVVNALRLLQTLDKDGNPDNGIQIDDAAHDTAANLTIDFGSPTFDSDVAALVTHSGSTQTQLVSADQAKTHFEQAFGPQQLAKLTGAWQLQANWYNQNVASVITFLDDLHYVAVEPLGGCHSGAVEFGSFTWDPFDGGSFTRTIATATTAGCGYFGTPYQPDTLTLALNGKGNLAVGLAADKVPGTKLTNASSLIVGSWVAQGVGASNSTVVATFLPDGGYIIAASGDEQLDPSGHDGYEKGSYTWDESSGAMTATMSEGDGIWQIHEQQGTFAITAHPGSSPNAGDRGPPTAVWSSGGYSVEFTYVGSW